MITRTLRTTVSRILPRQTLKQVRVALERYFDWPWQRRYYSQFGEDAVLINYMQHEAWLKGETKIATGYYVDVGAFSPKIHSNTYMFYKMGWRGINLDATPGSKELFDGARPRDINLEVAISNLEHELIFHSWGTPNVGNTFSPEFAAEWERQMNRPPEKIKIRTRTLSSVLGEYVRDRQPMEFMSVDVEGHNLEVLQSNDWSKFRPTFLIVEGDVEYSKIEDVISSELFLFLQEQRYNLIAWMTVSLIFRRMDD